MNPVAFVKRKTIASITANLRQMITDLRALGDSLDKEAAADFDEIEKREASMFKKMDERDEAYRTATKIEQLII